MTTAMARQRLSPEFTGYRRGSGHMTVGLAEEVIGSKRFDRYRGKVQLILTSPPFPLNRRKRYGNLQGEEYKEWLASFAPIFRELLTPTGSIVLEVGNAWEPRRPVMSTLTVESLLAFLKGGDLNLCQQFISHNPARLPSPVQWVNIDRVRVKDSFTHIWWMSPTDHPRANNRDVLTEYSPRMKALHRRGSYNTGRRPSEHIIGEASFLTDNGGAIPSNVLEHSNTVSCDYYRQYCLDRDLPIHPARMPAGISKFFIEFLTSPGDLVLDPFAGSNTTGAMAHTLNRKWIAIEANPDYAEGSQGRFIRAESV
jgi:site-specific DNA-methyltransferase (cytosine-N4-specific)